MSEIMTEAVWHESNDATRLATLGTWWATMLARYRKVNDVILPGYQMEWLLAQAAKPTTRIPVHVGPGSYRAIKVDDFDKAATRLALAVQEARALVAWTDGAEVEELDAAIAEWRRVVLGKEPKPVVVRPEQDEEFAP